MSYVNRLRHAPVLQGYRVVRKSKYTMKVTNQLTNRNKIKKKIMNIKYRGKGARKGRDKSSQCL